MVVYKLKLSKHLRATYVLRHGVKRKQYSPTQRQRVKAKVKPEVNVLITTILMVASFAIALCKSIALIIIIYSLALVHFMMYIYGRVFCIKHLSILLPL